MTTCVIDIGNNRIKLAIFINDKISRVRSIANQEIHPYLELYLKEANVTHVFINEENTDYTKQVVKIILDLCIPLIRCDRNQLSMKYDIETTNPPTSRTLANLYGALHHFPCNNCLVVEMNRETKFDYVTQDGIYLGGACFPIINTDKSPANEVIKPKEAIQKDTQLRLYSGIYYGILGAIERICAELIINSPSPSSVKIITTGDMIELASTFGEESSLTVLDDLKDITDTIDPHLSLWGLHEILKEHLSNTQEK
ncbi:MAG: type III pantothenate kinase [Chlamydiae bacterium]|nr:type III pantothenate kinase [Chlamydiota bacterium]